MSLQHKCKPYRLVSLFDWSTLALFFLITGTTAALSAETVPDSFKGFQKYTLAGTVTVYCQPNICSYDGAVTAPGLDTAGLVSVSFSGKGPFKGKLYIGFDPGPSDDPEFVFFKMVKKKLVRLDARAGLRLFITASRSLYIDGHTNNYFSMKHKFTLGSGRLLEVRQPFYYAGIDTKTTRPVILYEKKNRKKEVARLGKGAAVRVIASDGKEWFLLATPFGLTGWHRLEQLEHPYTSLKDISFAGD